MQTFYQNINTLVNNTNSKFRISIYIITQIINNNNLYLDKKIAQIYVNIVKSQMSLPVQNNDKTDLLKNSLA